MDNEKQFLKFVGTTSERAGAFAGKVASIGDKIAGLATGSVTAGKEMLDLADKKVIHTSEKKSDNTKISTLKSDLAAARRKLANEKKAQSKLESQLKELKTENHSLASELDQMRSELSETKSRESAVRARATALESELDDIRSQLEEAQSKPAKTSTVGTGRGKRATELKSELVAIQQELEDTRKKAEKTQSEFASQLEALQVENKSLSSDLEKTQSKSKEVQADIKSQISNLQSENKSLKSELEKQQSEDNKMLDLEEKLKTRATQLEADLVAAQSELAETRNHTETTRSQLASQVEDLQAEKDSLISGLEKARNEANEITSQQEIANGQVASLESELATARSELQEVQSRAESTQTELTSQVEKLQLEKESLNSELQTAQSQVDEAKARENVMKTKTAALESEVTILRSELARARESESDNNAIQAEEQNGFSKVEEEVKEPATAPVDTEEVESSKEVAVGTIDDETNERTEEQPTEMVVAAKQTSKLPLQEISSPQTEHKEKADIEQAVKEIGPLTEVAAQEEQIDINVEEPELKSESQAQSEVAPAHSAEVTAEDVQAADFKNGAERILFSKAISDFVSQDATTRANAAAAIAGIHHELSPRLLISHMANEPSARVRQECIKALSALESKEGLSAIEQALADEAASVRLAAVWGLYRLTGTESIPLLTRMLSDKDASVRRRAVTCIGWLGGQISKAGNHSSHQVISALVQCLNDPVVTNAALDTLQTVTGKKMSAPRTSPERLIEQWQKWWKAELLG